LTVGRVEGRRIHPSPSENINEICDVIILDLKKDRNKTKTLVDLIKVAVEKNEKI